MPPSNLNYLAANTVLQGRYRIVRRLGQGGFGAVYEALDSRISSLVALKQTFARSAAQRQAFHQEAKLLGNLKNETFPHVIDHFFEGEGQYLVMELIPGDNLWERLEERAAPYPEAKVLEWADQLLDALQDLHNNVPPIIHRDIKPPNMKLSPKGRIKLLDFGIAKGTAGQMTVNTSQPDSAIGYTRHYAPLEQIIRSDPTWVRTLSLFNEDAVNLILNSPTDPKSDLYSLGATLFHLVTNRLPDDATARAIAVWTGRPDPLVTADSINPQVNPAVATILNQAMALDRVDRPQSALIMRRALQQAADRRPVPPRPVGPVDANTNTEWPIPYERSYLRQEIVQPGDRTLGFIAQRRRAKAETELQQWTEKAVERASNQRQPAATAHQKEERSEAKGRLPMARKILGVVTGYIVFSVCLFLLFSGLYMALGPNSSFIPGKYDPSMTWTVAAFALGFVAAVIGGFVAALIGKSGAVKIMAVMVVLIGAIVVVMLVTDTKPVEVRTGDVPNMQAMMKAKEPVWVGIVNPILGAIGVLAGGALRKNK